MEIKILKDEKNCLDIELSSLTITEVIRAYLANEDVKLVAWKRSSPSSNPVLHIEAERPKKVLALAIANLEKELDTAVSDFKNLK